MLCRKVQRIEEFGKLKKSIVSNQHPSIIFMSLFVRNFEVHFISNILSIADGNVIGSRMPKQKQQMSMLKKRHHFR